MLGIPQFRFLVLQLRGFVVACRMTKSASVSDGNQPLAGLRRAGTEIVLPPHRPGLSLELYCLTQWVLSAGETAQ